MSTTNHATTDLVDPRGRKYVTADERKRFLAAVRAHPKPSVQTLARTLALTGWRESEALAPTGARSRSPRISCRRSASYHASEPPARAPAAHHPPKRRAPGRPLMRDARIHRPPACPRSLRHAFGVAGITAGVPHPTIAAVLGYADLSTTAAGAEAREVVARVWS